MNPLYLHAEGYQPEINTRTQDILDLRLATIFDIEVSDYIPNDEIHIINSQGEVTRIVKIS